MRTENMMIRGLKFWPSLHHLSCFKIRQKSGQFLGSSRSKKPWIWSSQKPKNWRHKGGSGLRWSTHGLLWPFMGSQPPGDVWAPKNLYAEIRKCSIDRQQIHPAEFIELAVASSAAVFFFLNSGEVVKPPIDMGFWTQKNRSFRWNKIGRSPETWEKSPSDRMVSGEFPATIFLDTGVRLWFHGFEQENPWALTIRIFVAWRNGPRKRLGLPCKLRYGGFHSHGGTQNGWFMKENPIVRNRLSLG